MQKFEAPIAMLEASRSDFIGPRLTSMARIWLKFQAFAKESPVHLRLTTDYYLRAGRLPSDEKPFIFEQRVNRSSDMTVVLLKKRPEQSKDCSFILHDMELPLLDNPITHKDNRNG